MANNSKNGILSANALKLIAVATMAIDHISVIFNGTGNTVLRDIGRISFPIFAFLIAEGAMHTKNKAKYALRLLAFAFISEIPFDIVFNGVWLEYRKQNVFFTLFLGLISVYALDFLRDRHIGALGIITTLACGMGAALLSSDYGFMGVVIITLMYMFGTVKTDVRYLGFALAGFISCIVYVFPDKIGFLPSQIYASLCFIPLSLYNGKRGRKMNKYFFYLFYPVHILIIYLIKLVIT